MQTDDEGNDHEHERQHEVMCEMKDLGLVAKLPAVSGPHSAYLLRKEKEREGGDSPPKPIGKKPLPPNGQSACILPTQCKCTVPISLRRLESHASPFQCSFAMLPLSR
jgi:hypothetical protein